DDGDVAIDVRSFCWQVRPLLTTRSDTQSRQNATTALALTVGDSHRLRARSELAGLALPTAQITRSRAACGDPRARWGGSWVTRRGGWRFRVGAVVVSACGATRGAGACCGPGVGGSRFGLPARAGPLSGGPGAPRSGHAAVACW